MREQTRLHTSRRRPNGEDEPRSAHHPLQITAHLSPYWLNEGWRLTSTFMAPALTDDPFGQCIGRRELLANEESYRFELALRYSYVLPESHLLEVISRYSPLVEVGAGTGYWAYLLRSMGVDVIAYDLAPFGSSVTNRYHLNSAPGQTSSKGTSTRLPGTEIAHYFSAGLQDSQRWRARFPNTPANMSS